MLNLNLDLTPILHKLNYGYIQIQDHQNTIDDCMRTVTMQSSDEWDLMFEDLHNMLKDSVTQFLFFKKKGKTEISMSYYLDSKYSQMIKK